MEAFEIAADGRDGIRECTGQKMKKRLFLNRIYLFCPDFAIDQADQCAIAVLAYTADPPSAWLYSTLVQTESACHL